MDAYASFVIFLIAIHLLVIVINLIRIVDKPAPKTVQIDLPTMGIPDSTKPEDIMYALEHNGVDYESYKGGGDTIYIDFSANEQEISVMEYGTFSKTGDGHWELKYTEVHVPVTSQSNPRPCVHTTRLGLVLLDILEEERRLNATQETE